MLALCVCYRSVCFGAGCVDVALAALCRVCRVRFRRLLHHGMTLRMVWPTLALCLPLPLATLPLAIPLLRRLSLRWIQLQALRLLPCPLTLHSAIPCAPCCLLPGAATSPRPQSPFPALMTSPPPPIPTTLVHLGLSRLGPRLTCPLASPACCLVSSPSTASLPTFPFTCFTCPSIRPLCLA